MEIGVYILNGFNKESEDEQFFSAGDTAQGIKGAIEEVLQKEFKAKEVIWNDKDHNQAGGIYKRDKSANILGGSQEVWVEFYLIISTNESGLDTHIEQMAVEDIATLLELKDESLAFAVLALARDNIMLSEVVENANNNQVTTFNDETEAVNYFLDMSDIPERMRYLIDGEKYLDEVKMDYSVSEAEDGTLVYLRR